MRLFMLGPDHWWKHFVPTLALHPDVVNERKEPKSLQRAFVLVGPRQRLWLRAGGSLNRPVMSRESGHTGMLLCLSKAHLRAGDGEDRVQLSGDVALEAPRDLLAGPGLGSSLGCRRG